MYVVVNVISNERADPTSCLVQPIGAHGSEVMYFGIFFFRSELCFLNCDDICMWDVNKQFELFEVFFLFVYVDLKYEEISLIFTARCVSLCGVCSQVVVMGPVCEVVLVPCVVVALTVMRVLLFLCEVGMLRECGGDGNAGVGAGEVWLRRVYG